LFCAIAIAWDQKIPAENPRARLGTIVILATRQLNPLRTPHQKPHALQVYVLIKKMTQSLILLVKHVLQGPLLLHGKIFIKQEVVKMIANL
jgi:hypothetical protein